MGAMGMILFCLPEGGECGEDSFQSRVLREIVRKWTAIVAIETLAYLFKSLINHQWLPWRLKITAHPLMRFHVK